jgi:hypothetical protein
VARDRLDVRTADGHGVATMLSWATEEGWNPGLDDAAAFQGADPGGFLLGWLDGEPIAAVSLVRYDDAFGFLGLYIVRPAFRGRGHGLTMWHAALDLADDRVVGLDGVVAQRAAYARSGFVLVRRNVRYEGRGGGGRPPGMTSIDEVGFEAISTYDRTVFPAGRARFLEGWLRPEGGVGLAVVRDGALRGYGVVRPCRVGFKIGPLFADAAEDAEAIFGGLAAHAGDAALFLDVPEPNGAAVRLAAARGMTPVFETARMYLGAAPDEPVDRIFGVTTFELG